MKDKTNEQLLKEIIDLQQQIIKLKKVEKKYEQISEELSESKVHIEATLNALPDLLFEVDRKGHVYDYHSSSSELLLLSPEEFIGKTVNQILPKEAADVIMKAIVHASETGHHSGAMYCLELHSGKRWFELSIAAKREPRGKEGRLIALARDVTQRKEMEDALEEREVQFRNLFMNAGVGMFRSKFDGSRVLAVNHKISRILGYSEEELLSGPALIRWINKEDRKKMQQLLSEKGEVIDFEAPVLAKDETVKSCLISAKLYPDGQYLEGTVVDITERKKMEEEQERLIEELKRALVKIKTLKGLIPICSHCKNIRDDKGYWHQLEAYVKEHTGADFSHGICPDCIKKFYPELSEDLE
jgi:PAS domain S-box-containing protein